MKTNKKNTRIEELTRLYKVMGELYDSECKRLGLKLFENPPFLPVSQQRMNWFVDISMRDPIITNKFNLDDFKDGNKEICFRGVPLKVVENAE